MDEELLKNNGWFNRWIRENGSLIGVVAYMLVVIALIFMCSSCSTKTRIEYRDRYIDNYITQIVHDTVREQSSDSVYHEIIVRNDTVYNTKYKERIKYRDRVVERTDTCWRDSVVTEYKETVKEVRHVPTIYKYAMFIAIAALLFVGFKIYKKIRGVWIM